MKSLLTNRKLRTAGLLLVLLAMAPGLALARSATPPPAGQRVYDMEWLNINKWLCPFHNDGRYGYDPTTGTGSAGGSWPQPLKNCYIFGAGLWFGSIKARASDPTRRTRSSRSATTRTPAAPRCRRSPSRTARRVRAAPTTGFSSTRPTGRRRPATAG